MFKTQTEVRINPNQNSDLSSCIITFPHTLVPSDNHTPVIAVLHGGMQVGGFYHRASSNVHRAGMEGRDHRLVVLGMRKAGSDKANFSLEDLGSEFGTRRSIPWGRVLAWSWAEECSGYEVAIPAALVVQHTQGTDVIPFDPNLEGARRRYGAANGFEGEQEGEAA